MEKLAGYGLMTPEGTRLVEEFHWIESGRGEPVVLLHGLLGAPDGGYDRLGRPLW